LAGGDAQARPGGIGKGLSLPSKESKSLTKHSLPP
jgi:hypothetical protein